MKIGFVGLGNLGKDVAEVIYEKYNIVGYDIKFVDTIVPQVTLKEACRDKDIIFIAVPTPHDSEYDGRFPTSHLPPKDFNYDIVKQVLQEVDKLVTKNSLIVLISTVLPGTVRNQLAYLIYNGRFIYNPYLIAQGTVKEDMVSPEMIIIGTKLGETSKEANILKSFYSKIVSKETRYAIGTWEEAESIKIFYNTFISTKLVLVNMIQDIAERIGYMNVDIVTDALKYSDKRIMGPSYMTAGLGDGGGCHPRDNIALRSIVQKFNLGYDLFDSIMSAREKQAENMAHTLVSYGTPVIIVGKSFKPGVHQDMGSPAILVGYYCEKLGAEVYYDEVPKKVQKLTYMIHDYEMFSTLPIYDGSIIFDIFRKLGTTDSRSSPYINNSTILQYGNSR